MKTITKRQQKQDAQRLLRQAAYLAQVVALHGTKDALAKKLGVTYQAIQRWEKTQVPGERCRQIERASGGLVKPWQLREDWHELYGDGTPA